MPTLCQMGTTNERDFVPSRKHRQEHFSTDSTARKRNRQRNKSAVDPLNGCEFPSRVT